MYQYRVIPFIGKIKETSTIQEVSSQLQQLITENAGQGWEFYSIERIAVVIKLGCLSALFGNPTRQISYDQIIFRKES